MYNVVGTKKINFGRFELIMDTVEKNGEKHPFSFVKIRSGVCVIPFVDDNQVILLREYRHPIKSWQYQFACGMIDEGESPEEAAKRELEEEIGCVAEEIYELGYTYPSFGSTTEKIYLFAAKCAEIRRTDCEPLEYIEYHKTDVKTIEKMFAENEIVSSASQVAWFRWKLSQT